MSNSNQEIIFLEPAFVPKIWGGKRLIEMFDLKLEENIKIGEAWLISALPKAMSYVSSGTFKGLSLKDLYDKQPALFAFHKSKSYPLLSKILDAKDNLSVQFHPDDVFAKKNCNSFGKTECWYIMDCKQNQQVIYGHKAINKVELSNCLDEKNYSKLLSYIPIFKKQFVYVPALKVHGLLANTMVFELQQASDITYRIYDFDRVDKKSQTRKINIEEAKNLLLAPDLDTSTPNSHDQYLVDNEYFKLVKIENKGSKNYSYINAKWLQMSVLEGSGMIDGTKIRKNNSFILPNGYYSFNLTGKLIIMLSFC